MHFEVLTQSVDLPQESSPPYFPQPLSVVIAEPAQRADTFQPTKLVSPHAKELHIK